MGYDLVIGGARVIDPETNTGEIPGVAVKDGSIPKCPLRQRIGGGRLQSGRECTPEGAGVIGRRLTEARGSVRRTHTRQEY